MDSIIAAMKRVVTLLSILLFVASACASDVVAPTGKSPVPSNPNLILATTTSTQDSGLLDVLIPLFEAETGYVVKTVAVGTGQALKMGEEGNADVLLVHAPQAEEEFMENGFGKDRTPVMHNDFIIVGAESDPAGVEGMKSAIEALQLIHASGSLFISRGDDSGTHKKELDMWRMAELDPTSQPWYLETGQGMGATLTVASEKGAYTITDRGTFLAQRGTLDLVIVLEGDPPLINPYHVITVNPARWANVNYDGAIAFLKFITTPEIQELIGGFGVEEYGEPLFFPDGL